MRALSGQAVLDQPKLMTQIYTMAASNFRDITSGSNGGYTAVAGYDLVTGRGTPCANLLIPTLVGTAVVAGRVFSDANNNGVLDGESGLAGWTVYQDLNSNNVREPVVTNTFNSADVPKTINDLATTTSTNVVAGLAGNIIDVNVTINLTHTDDSDLTITLISPAASGSIRVPLAVKAGGSGMNYTSTTFDDTATIPISAGLAPFSGTYIPQGLLSSLFDTTANGTWTLEIVDGDFLQTGTLLGWSLQLTTGDPFTTSDASGFYQLIGFAATYRLQQVLQAGYVQTAPAGGFFTETVIAGGNLQNRNFGDRQLVSSAPTGVSLSAASDTGSSNSDKITKLNNGNAVNVLTFAVSGTIAGATVTLWVDGTAIGSAVAPGTTTNITSTGSFLLSDGDHTFTATQTEPGKSVSPGSPGQVVKIDATAPTVTIDPVVSNLRTTPVSTMGVRFNEAVSGLNLPDLTLKSRWRREFALFPCADDFDQRFQALDSREPDRDHHHARCLSARPDRRRLRHRRRGGQRASQQHLAFVHRGLDRCQSIAVLQPVEVRRQRRDDQRGRR